VTGADARPPAALSAVHTDQAPAAIGPYSQAIVCGEMVYTSGQIALRAGVDGLVGHTAAEQAEVVLQNLAAVLEAAGSGLSCVVKVTVYLTDLSEFGDVGRVYAAAFGDHRPARSTVQVSALPRGARIEMDCIAQRG